MARPKPRTGNPFSQITARCICCKSHSGTCLGDREVLRAGKMRKGIVRTPEKDEVSPRPKGIHHGPGIISETLQGRFALSKTSNTVGRDRQELLDQNATSARIRWCGGGRKSG